MEIKEYTNRELGIILENIQDSQNQFHTEMKEYMKDSIKRLDSLERWRSGIVAVIALITFVVPIIISAYYK